MELTFTQELTFSLDLDVKLVRELARHLGITVRQLKKLADDGELYDQYGDEILAWLSEHGDKWETTAHEDIDNLEIHV